MREEVVCVVTHSDRFLLVRRPDAAVWGFPRVGIRYDADIHEIALRLVKKQLGLRGELRYSAAPIGIEDLAETRKSFPVQVRVRETDVTLAPKHYAACRWVSMDELQRLPSDIGCIECVESLDLPE